METDSIIIWINFLIVVLLLVKFAAKPFMDFLKNRNKIKSIELSSLETEKEKISGEIGETLMIINEKKSLLSDTEKNIIRQGESIKAGIIKDAGIQSELILAKAKQEAGKEINRATEKFRTEVINEVFDKVSARKPNSLFYLFLAPSV
jgi:F0F1-type ATP synthase membrane subunit b/b'